MHLFLKIISWSISLVISFFSVSAMVIYDYICILFNMPVEIWNMIGEDDDAAKKEV